MDHCGTYWCTQDRQRLCWRTGARGDEPHLLLLCPAMQPVLEKSMQFYSVLDYYRALMFARQENLFLVTCYTCACTQLHATLLEERTLNNQAGVACISSYPSSVSNQTIHIACKCLQEHPKQFCIT